MLVAERITAASSTLTPAERRIAEIVLSDAQVVAFGTVADLARQASAGAATVVRLANKIGFDGFTGLQLAIQEELARRLRPAAERIRHTPAADVAGRTAAIEVDNVVETFAALDRAAFERAVTLLTDLDRGVVVLSGEASVGVASQIAGELGELRPNVRQSAGNDVAVRRDVALLDAGDVVLAVDLRRYDRWLVAGVRQASEQGCVVVSISDSLLSPLAAVSAAAMTVVAAGAGPFDSHVGTLALGNALVTACAARLRRVATARLDRLEAIWSATEALQSD